MHFHVEDFMMNVISAGHFKTLISSGRSETVIKAGCSLGCWRMQQKIWMPHTDPKGLIQFSLFVSRHPLVKEDSLVDKRVAISHQTPIDEE